MNIREELFKNQDDKYAEFQSKLIPNIPREKIIGVRIPTVRKLAKQAVYDNALSENYYLEEIMITGMKIGYEKCSIEKRLRDLEKFVPLIDNWAVCDCCCSTFKFTQKNMTAVWDFIQPYINGGEYEIRFAVVMMMDYFLNDEYVDRVLEILASIKSDKYYVNMAVAWALSVAFVKYKNNVTAIIDEKLLSKWVHNKTIQKICESYRVDKQTKDELKLKKIK
ncbi:MAG: DNA alkylation repair protein [Eubacteriales bacterium]|nr:DNA alkylation repair protein [Eubacteriales bacterium]